MTRRELDIDVPDQTGRLAVVTGATDGIGLGIARRLAAAGAEVVLPARSPEKGQRAAETIRAQVPGARISVPALDLASLESVVSFGEELRAQGRPVHVLVDNAGVMAPPERRTTADGFELQLGTNHLGHVALVAALLPLLREGRARVVHQVSVAARRGAVHWEDLQWERSYDAMRAYSSSKIAFGLWGLELDRRSRAAGWGITSSLSHPGVAPTNLLAAQPGMGRTEDTREVRVIRALSRRGILVGTAASAALPAVHAATSPGAGGGRLYGPGGLGHLGGRPTEQRLYPPLRDEAEAARVWERSAELAGVELG